MRSDLIQYYDELNHPVDTNSQDFVNVMEYLRSHGLPYPEVIHEDVGIPTGPVFQNIYLVYTSKTKPALKMLACLVMNRPQGAVVDHQLWRGVKEVVIPEEYAPPVVPVPIVTPAPKVLVGPLMFGDTYYPVSGDDSPNGFEYSDGRGRFVKQVVPTPFGNSVCWKRKA